MENSEQQRKDEQRATVDSRNRQALVDLMEQHRVTLGSRTFDKWRPTVATDGLIDGFWHLGELRCFATDGLQGLFAPTYDADTDPHCTLVLRHIQNFRWSVPVISMISYYDPIAGRNKVFQVVKDVGAPAPLFSVPREVQVKAEGKPKKKSKKQQILDSL